jgi:hypothetical protein
MRRSLKRTVLKRVIPALTVLVLLVLATTPEANCQTAGVVHSASRAPEPASEPGANDRANNIAREIDDPHTGARWLLLRDSSHPGGPGRLVLAVERRGQHQNNVAQSDVVQAAPALPVIHAGDRLIVEENSAVIEARLEAVAMSPAAAGSLLQARLRIGGRVVRVVALGPGRAEFQSEIGVRP